MKLPRYINKELGILIILIGAFFCVTSTLPALAVPTTNAATGVNTTGATLNGLTDIAGSYWFEVSGTASGYTWATETQAVGAGAAIAQTVDGIPLISGNTYYFRLCRSGSCGAQQSFALGAIGVLPTTTYTTRYFKPFVNTKWNMSQLAVVVPQPYFDKFGYLIWAIFWGAILMAFWVRQEDVTLPAFVYLIIYVTLSLSNYLPSSFVMISAIFAAICLGALLYPIFRGRKHG